MADGILHHTKYVSRHVSKVQVDHEIRIGVDPGKVQISPGLDNLRPLAEGPQILSYHERNMPKHGRASDRLEATSCGKLCKPRQDVKMAR